MIKAKEHETICDFDSLEAIVYGGSILGGGGGGFLAEGLETVKLALGIGKPRIISLSQVAPNESLVMVATVGAPAGRNRFVKAEDFIGAVRKLIEASPCRVSGIITNEMGGRASANGLIQSAVLGLPIIDAPANGRAHPFGLMGSLGLHKDQNYFSIQAAFGGNPDRKEHLELLVSGEIGRCDSLIREASIHAGGLVAVARNPVRASWLARHAAVGAIKFALNLGITYLESLKRKGGAPAEEIASCLGGEVLAKGKVTSFELSTRSGFDVGLMILDTGHELTFCNEYITVEKSKKRLYTFPDLITTIDASSNLTINTAEISVGMNLVVVCSKRENLILGEGMRDPKLFEILEGVIGLPIMQYAFDGI